MKKTEDNDAFSEAEHRHDNTVNTLDYASVNKSVINVIIMYAGKLKKTFILAKSTHLQADPQQSTQVVGYKHTRKKPVDISDGAK